MTANCVVLKDSSSLPFLLKKYFLTTSQVFKCPNAGTNHRTSCNLKLRGDKRVSSELLCLSLYLTNDYVQVTMRSRKVFNNLKVLSEFQHIEIPLANLPHDFLTAPIRYFRFRVQNEEKRKLISSPLEDSCSAMRNFKMS
ncbi:CLUMA_CG007286, isoform A [Clunio marinus]|uniref:CLUMA_CG007286, isoform A n=1 Tax=Clunio marinus TaxID=568069 RepID=A0A1J1I4F8_9DIPT|nr:CLUMA_CG007286, isoform A [Clunio marinus]